MSAPFELHVGDAADVLALCLEDASVDAIVCDPPYGLAFMGKRWDYDVPPAALWAECLRVLKPGGYLLAFAGTRTHHRMAVNIEDAGFEIRDMIAWVYGSGFPKSLDVAKAVDKRLQVAGEYGGPKSAAHAGWIDRGRMRGDEGHEGYQRPWMEDAEAVDRNARQYLPGSREARQWSGWGTALKPALEPIVVARRPLAGTVADNVLSHGTGGLNIDGCRVDGGRWPANLVHDDSPEVRALFPNSNGSGGSLPQVKITGYGDGVVGTGKSEYHGGPRTPHNAGSGSAARFFYAAKASRADREEGLEGFPRKSNVDWPQSLDGDDARGAAPRANNHPTVKPTALMRWLCRLVTPPGGLILDPFAGSGSTGKAAILEGFQFVGVDREAEYIELARARCLHAWRKAA